MPSGGGGKQLRERRSYRGIGDLLVVDEQVAEDCLVEAPAGLIAGGHVQGVRIFEDSKTYVEEVLRIRKVVRYVLELFGQPRRGSRCRGVVVGSGPYERAGRGEVKQVVFLDVQTLQLLSQIASQQASAACAVRQRLAHGVA
ncbi:hypothetical protein ASD37_19605 [Mycobacterium sp. Root135]|nr:hypothetical protein ASD37_19605 [Mycobacterium sp. Root135]